MFSAPLAIVFASSITEASPDRFWIHFAKSTSVMDRHADGRFNSVGPWSFRMSQKTRNSCGFVPTQPRPVFEAS
jgi:hypothetical protein